MNVWEFRQMYESQMSMEGLILFGIVLIVAAIVYAYFSGELTWK